MPSCPPSANTPSVYDHLPRFIAHRGASGHAPENTAAAIAKAHELGATWAEVDVTISADGEAVIFHDHKLERCSNGRGLIIQQPLADLKTLDAGSWFSPFYKEEKILTLSELLSLADDLNLSLNIEIKPTIGREWETVQAMQSAFRDTAFSQHILLSSFNERALCYAAELLPQFDRGLNVEAIPADWQKRLKQCLATGLHFQLDFFDGGVIRQLREQGVPLACFTVNNIVDAQRLWEAGVNAVFTDYIERLRITP
ncbi:MAG: glycerophosphodiester phosphodiesterase [Oceanospirillaceae bacterium]|nr:glycerophosphodiester phosphodiesterase [Oceanospirillaceae bacterium]|tara:strand:+ start:2420 stop:3184 length:765 start_codon:yes stop_codon:yes gene_type:complete